MTNLQNEVNTFTNSTVPTLRVPDVSFRMCQRDFPISRFV